MAEVDGTVVAFVAAGVVVGHDEVAVLVISHRALLGPEPPEQH